jgi:uncharacterized protein (DUF362 family)
MGPAPGLVATLVAHLVSRGASPVVCADRAQNAQAGQGTTMGIFANSGDIVLVEAAGGTCVALEDSIVANIQPGGEGRRWFPSLDTYQDVVESEYIIDVARCAAHDTGIFTGVLKNMMGVITQNDRNIIHGDYTMIADMFLPTVGIRSGRGIKPDLYIIDCQYAAFEQYGEIYTLSPGIVIASKDPIAAEVAMLCILKHYLRAEGFANGSVTGPTVWEQPQIVRAVELAIGATREQITWTADGVSDAATIMSLLDESPALKITTTGSTFSPLFTLSSGTGIIEWSNGTRESTNAPSANFGSSSTRIHYFRCPASTLRAANFGYSIADGYQVSGSYQLAEIAGQGVSALDNLTPFRSYLVRLGLSECPISMLNISGYYNLVDLEAFESMLTDIDSTGCSALRRLCVESNNLTGMLNLSGTPALEDLRAANQGLTGVTLPPGGLPNIWHFCIRDSASMLPGLPLSGLTNATELFIYGCNQTGTLAPQGTNLAILLANSNAYTSVDLSGCPNVHYINLASIATLNTAAVDAILHQLVLNGQSGPGCMIDLRGTAVPTATTDIATLVSRGWEVHVDS